MDWLWWALGGYLVLMSLHSYTLWALDKRAANRNGPRAPERRLLMLGLLGGALGGLVAMRVHRHKTRKQPFNGLYWLAFVGNAAWVGLVTFALLAAW